MRMKVAVLMVPWSSSSFFSFSWWLPAFFFSYSENAWILPKSAVNAARRRAQSKSSLLIQMIALVIQWRPPCVSLSKMRHPIQTMPRNKRRKQRATRVKRSSWHRTFNNWKPFSLTTMMRKIRKCRVIKPIRLQSALCSLPLPQSRQMSRSKKSKLMIGCRILVEWKKTRRCKTLIRLLMQALMRRSPLLKRLAIRSPQMHNRCRLNKRSVQSLTQANRASRASQAKRASRAAQATRAETPKTTRLERLSDYCAAAWRRFMTCEFINSPFVI